MAPFFRLDSACLLYLSISCNPQFSFLLGNVMELFLMLFQGMLCASLISVLGRGEYSNLIERSLSKNTALGTHTYLSAGIAGACNEG